MKLSKVAFFICLCTVWLGLAGPSFANTGPGKPATGGRRVLVIYNGDVAFNALIVNGASGLRNLLTSAGAYAGVGFNFTVEEIQVPEAHNAGQTYASGSSYVTANASLPLTAANYCIVFDLRFNNRNYNNGSGTAGPRGSNYVRGDTIVQADSTAYASYLASGGGLFILGDNYWDDSVSRADGFISRMENMYRLVNQVASTGVVDDTAFKLGAPSVLAVPSGTNPYVIETDFNALNSVTTLYPGPIVGTGSGRIWSHITGQPTHGMGVAWDGPAGDLLPAYNTGRMIYYGDVSAVNDWAGGGATNMRLMFENTIDYLFNDNCCTPPATLCGAGPDVEEPTDMNVIECFVDAAHPYTFPAGSGSWVSGGDRNGIGGFVRNTVGLFSDNTLFQVNPVAGDLALYSQLCFSMRHGLGSAVTVQIWNQSFGQQMTTAAASIPAGAGWTDVCLTFNAFAGPATQLRFRVMYSGGVSTSYDLDAVSLRHGCGVQPRVVDPACCNPATSPTFTPTATRTRTPTPSRTASPTLTATPTRSPTRTATPTASLTATPSATPTQSPTRTATPTSSLTFTPSATPTPSPTRTSTVTHSPTNTEGPSPTYSSTRTATPTATGTFSFTHTPSHTPSSTPTATPSVTFTRSDTPSVTPTITVTTPYSPTSTPTVTPTATQTVTFTPSQTFSATPTVTPTATQTVTFTPSQTFSATPTATPSSTASPSPTVSWSVTDSPTPSVTATASLTVTVSFTYTVSPTITPTPIPVPVRLVVMLYNSAGERVRLLYEGGARSVPTSVSLSEDLLLSGAGSVSLLMDTLLADGGAALAWGGANDAGQFVSSGTYYFKLEFQDSFGATTSFIKGVQVLEPMGTDQVNVYNSAGELVWSRSLAGVTRPAGLTLDRDVLVLERDPGTGKAIERLGILLSGIQAADWAGEDRNGAFVSSGTYVVQVVSQRAGGSRVVESKSISVLDAGTAGPDLQAVAGPNPWTGDGPLKVRYTPYPGAQGHARLFNLAGEWVGSGQDAGASGRLEIHAPDLAGGVYLLEFSQRLGQAVLGRRLIKVAVVK